MWAVLTKDRFPVGEYNRLSAKKIELVEIIEKINSNAYHLKLPTHIRIADFLKLKIWYFSQGILQMIQIGGQILSTLGRMIWALKNKPLGS